MQVIRDPGRSIALLVTGKALAYAIIQFLVRAHLRARPAPFPVVEFAPGYAQNFTHEIDRPGLLMRIEVIRMSLRVDLSTNVLVKIRKLGVGKRSKALMNIDQAGQLLAGTVASAISVLRADLSNGNFTLIQSLYQSLRDGGSLPVAGEDGHATVDVLDQTWATPSAKQTDRALCKIASV